MILDLVAEDINALPEDSIAVREKWKEKRALSRPEVLKSFAPATVARLRQEIAPLMQWRNIRGRGDAMALDLLIARMQLAVLRGSGALADLKIDLMDRLAALQMHLNPVREKAQIIKRVQSTAFWTNASATDLEEARIDLRRSCITAPGLVRSEFRRRWSISLRMRGRCSLHGALLA